MKKCEMCCIEIIRVPSKYESGRFCSRFCARKFSTYAKRKEINKKVSLNVKEKVNNGVFKSLKPRESREQKIIRCPICQSEKTVWNKSEQIYCSKKCMLLDVNYKFRSKPKTGGIRKNSGRSKTGYYHGVWCQSTYELAYVIYNLDHNIVFERNTEKFLYMKNGEEHYYLPDFIENGVLIETKGYFRPEVLLKTNCVNKPIKVMYRKDLLYAFDYIKQKYNKTGLSLCELYDDYKPKYDYECVFCKKMFSTDVKKRTTVVFCSRSCSGKSVAVKNHKNRISFHKTIASVINEEKSE